MELIPTLAIFGGLVPPPPPGTSVATAERINRIWSDLVPGYGFTGLEMAPDGSGARFTGPTGDGLDIHPPVISFRRGMAAGGTVAQATERAEGVLGVVARELGIAQFFNLAVRLVYSAPLPDNDARGFVLDRVLSAREDELSELALDSEEPLWAGLKYVVPQPDGGVYRLLIEPLQADDMESLFIDLDAQFPGLADLEALAGRAEDVQGYVSGAVSRYLDGLLDPG